MEQKRIQSFFVTATMIIIVWYMFVMPRLMPQPQKPPAADQPDAPLAATPDAAQPTAGESPEQPEPAAPVADWTPAPHRVIQLGSLDPDSGYRHKVTLDSRGAAVATIELNDPRYRDLLKPHPPLSLVGHDFAPQQLATLQTDIPLLDKALDKVEKGLTSRSAEWEVVPGSESESSVTFRLRAPDGSFEALKRYDVGQFPPGQPSREKEAYSLHVTLTLRNLSKTKRTAEYVLQGPVGVPLENAEYTRKYRDVVAGFLTESGGVHQMAPLTARKLVDKEAETWTRPVKYIGIDVQYFSVLLLPVADQLQQPYLAATQGELVGPAAEVKERSDISVLLKSLPLDIAPGGTVSHEYALFAGPKREEMMPEGAQGLIEWGISGGLRIPQMLTWVLHKFYQLIPNYGVAIILLTVLVRLLLFPLSRHQALSAAKMQELQPEIAALKKKFGNDHEKLGKAQMELFSKHNYNPLAGCLPMFLQLPIFFGLYQCLNISVDLRMAPFLWIQNLAAPDALFNLPFRIPFLGNQFHLLPLITIALMLIQQKLFMPPPADKEQEMQQQMMTYMMVFMGFMFYHVPAGLCLYFIVSSLWGVAERKILPKAKPKPVVADDAGSGPDGGPGKPDAPAPGPRDANAPEAPQKNLLVKLWEAAEKQQSVVREKPDKKKRDR